MGQEISNDEEIGSTDFGIIDSRSLPSSDGVDEVSVGSSSQHRNDVLKKKPGYAIVEGNSASNKSIERLLRLQKSILKKRVKNLSSHSLRKSRACFRHFGFFDESSQEISLEDRWEWYLESLPKRFFTSAGAQLRVTTQVCRGTPAYKGLLVNAGNCEDVQEIFENNWKSKRSLGQPISSYDQFRVAVGQLCRFAVATNVCSPHGLYNKGSVYALMTNSPAVKAFIGYFQIRSTAGTVMCKAMHLVQLAKGAYTFFPHLTTRALSLLSCLC